MVSTPQIYLASNSPRRRELLEQIGVRFERVEAMVDETPAPGEPPEGYVERLALAKARAGWVNLGAKTPRPVLGADTAVVVDDGIFGKPRDRAQGIEMLHILSGREHRVLSAVASVAGTREAVRLQESQVHFRVLSAAEIRAYWETGEPIDKAGAYGIQGRAAIFITKLNGSYSGVMGLPLFETAALMRDFGIKII